MLSSSGTKVAAPMLQSLSLRCACAVLLAVMSSAAIAATATISTEVNSLFDPNGVTAQFGCGNDQICDRDSVEDAPLLVSDPDGVSASSSVNYSFFSSFNTTSAPNFSYTGSAQAKASPGSLHASAEVQVTGTGGTSPAQGISAKGHVVVLDQLKVNSSTLANGTLVTLNALLDITGQGRGRAGLIVRGRKAGFFGPVGLFGDDDIANSNLDSLQDIAGQFTAQVGDTLQLEYFLQSSTGVSDAGWTAADSLNGRAANSSYGNSAYLYFSATDPANVTLQGLSGYDYVQPNPVPLPAALWPLLSGVVLLAHRRRA